MNKILPALMLLLLVLTAQAQPPKVVISQVFGAGSLSSSPLSHDFVELFNASDETVVLDGWSIQYSPATNNRWATGTVNLTGIIKPGHYYLIQFKGTEGVGKPLPEPDLVASGLIEISAANGKVALLNTTAALEGNCPAFKDVVDFVGYGTADCFETALAPATANNRSIMRLQNGCADTDNNASDFIAVVPSPRNGKSAANVCNAGTISVASISGPPYCITEATGAAGQLSFEANGSFTNATFTATLSDANGSFTSPFTIGSIVVNGNNPKGTIAVEIPKALSTSKLYRIRIDASQLFITGTASNAIEIINGAANVNLFSASPNADRALLKWDNPSGCFEEIMIVIKEGSTVTSLPAGDGSAYRADLNFNGNGTLFDGGKVVYKGTSSGQTITGLQSGKEYFVKAFTRNGNYWSPGVEIKVKPRLLPNPGEILINQVSPQYEDASFEYVELVNVTGKTFDLSELSISYHAASGNKAVAGNTLSGMLQPYSYWLVASKEIVTVGKTSLPRDGYLADGFAASAGQLSLLRKTDSTVIDGFGYGSIALQTYTENQPASAPSTKGGFKRKVEGKDNNNNFLDFERVSNADIDLRNSQSRLALKDAIINAGVYTRLYVTGNAFISGDVSITEKTVLQNGLLTLSNYQLTTSKTEGGSAISYYQTNGTGTVRVQHINETVTLVPVGNSSYNPVTISNGGGADWQVRVIDEITPASTPFDTKKAVLRTWQVKPLSNLSNGAAIQLFYNPNEQQVGAEFTDADVQVWHNGAPWLMTGEAQKQVKGNGTTAITVSNWKGAGNFVIANALVEMGFLTVLPIRFINVKATELPHAVQIEFTNATETDGAHYIIERSANGIDFLPIVTLNALQNNGGAAAYTWLDKTRPAGNNYYRIKGVEKDGKQMYSAVLKVVINKDLKGLLVFPNPVQGRQLTRQASLPQGAFLLRITATNGQQVVNKKFEHRGGNLSQVIELPAGMRPGIYNLQISNGQFEKRLMFVVL